MLQIDAVRVELADVRSAIDPNPVGVRVMHRGVKHGDELLGGHSAASTGEVRVRETKAAARLTSQ